MELIHQTKEGSEEGNCLAACLASILDIKIDDIPEVPNDMTWKDKTNEYLETLGYYLIEIIHDDSFELPIKGFHIMTGYNKKLDCRHAVVGRNGKKFFDPSKNKPELTDIVYGLVVKIL